MPCLEALKVRASEIGAHPRHGIYPMWDLGRLGSTRPSHTLTPLPSLHWACSFRPLNSTVSRCSPATPRPQHAPKSPLTTLVGIAWEKNSNQTSLCLDWAWLNPFKRLQLPHSHLHFAPPSHPSRPTVSSKKANTVTASNLYYIQLRQPLVLPID